MFYMENIFYIPLLYLNILNYFNKEDMFFVGFLFVCFVRKWPFEIRESTQSPFKIRYPNISLVSQETDQILHQKTHLHAQV